MPYVNLKKTFLDCNSMTLKKVNIQAFINIHNTHFLIFMGFYPYQELLIVKRDCNFFVLKRILSYFAFKLEYLFIKKIFSKNKRKETRSPSRATFFKVNWTRTRPLELEEASLTSMQQSGIIEITTNRCM